MVFNLSPALQRLLQSFKEAGRGRLHSGAGGASGLLPLPPCAGCLLKAHRGRLILRTPSGGLLHEQCGYMYISGDKGRWCMVVRRWSFPVPSVSGARLLLLDFPGHQAMPVVLRRRTGIRASSASGTVTTWLLKSSSMHSSGRIRCNGTSCVASCGQARGTAQFCNLQGSSSRYCVQHRLSVQQNPSRDEVFDF